MIHSKKCFKCETVKPLTEFYKHPMMADGHLNKCKECNKKDVKKNREKNIEYYREYDKKRANIPKRIVRRKEYASTEAGKDAHRKACQSYVSKYPYKAIAHNAVSNAIRDQKLVPPKNCESCGAIKPIQAHHDDYSKPYEVRWLCQFCHSQWHKNNKAKYPF
jgi:hypothetical protein